MISRVRSIFPVLMLLSCIVLLWSQVVPSGKKISSIEIALDGPKTLGKSFLLQNLQVEVGMIYDPNSIDKSIRNLIATGSVDDVKVFYDPKKSSAEGVALIFKVKAKARISQIRFSGNDKLSDKKLEKTISLTVGDLFDDSEFKSDQLALEKLYLEKGYWNAKISSDLKKTNANGGIEILFKIEENEKRKIRRIQFVGNSKLSSKELLAEMETAPWRFWRFWSKRSKYRPSILEEDLNNLKTLYRNQGFLDVGIDQSSVEIKPEGKSNLDLLIKISEGDRSFFGEYQVVGNVILSKDYLLDDKGADKDNRFEIKKGEPYSPAKLNAEISRLRRKYGEKGYLDVRIRSNRTPNLQTNQIDLKFEITENNKFSVNSVQVRGNEKTKTIAIIRELALAPGETFDLVRMETSESRLKNTRFFEKVDLDDEPVNSTDPELQNSRRNLIVDVKEGRTGHVSFGVGFSTLEKAMMFAEFRQGNFDIMRWRTPHPLQGDGQKFRLRLKLGSRSNEARLALEEPWFFNRRLAAGFEVFREKSDYYSSYYDEMRAGFEVYFRKRIFELVEGRLFYRFEDVEIDDVSTSAPSFITPVDLSISKVGLTLSRDTRDSILFPNDGSIFTLRKEFAGGIFGGDADYGRLEFQGARFIRTFDPMEQVLSIMGRTGTLGRFNGEDADVPFFDKFFLGGPYNLRGWDYRDAGPQSAGEPMGGNSYSYAGLEYTFKIADPLRFALFYDGGYLRTGDFKLLPGNGQEGWHDNWGMGLRIMVMGMPLRLDLGFPISDPSTTGGSPQFHFSGGTRF
ncbi:MAG: outer membrane protein assembly factor BamA [Verrucomicrobiota bacterium]|nr:outer membrane protein assembly factor BamA [Verrucomicrobiota bacterium]